MGINISIMISVALLTSFFGPLSALGEKNSRINNKYVPGELLIKYKDSTSPNLEFLNKYGLISDRQIIKSNKTSNNLKKWHLVKIKNNTDPLLIANEIRKDSSIEYAEPNYIVTASLTPNDPGFNQLWGLHNTAQTGGTADADIDALEAWETAKDTNLVVGIIDTGIDYTHEDLASNIWTNPGEISGNGLDDDGNGFIDDIHGWDFVGVGDNDPMDNQGHGTHVAGTIVAIGNNGIGVTGINWLGRVAALKFLDSNGSGTIADAVEAIQYANLMGLKVTNNSWGGSGYSQALYDAISTANTAGNLFVAAAGNNAINTDVSPSYPSSYNLPNIISVAATDHNDLLAYFSNYGANSVDLGAPGVNIYSTVPTGSCNLCNPSGYSSLNGTSMATPHVTGATALLWSYSPLLSHLDVKNKLFIIYSI